MEQQRRISRQWFALAVAGLICVGAVMVTAGVASASTVGHVPIIKFRPSSKSVSLIVPSTCPPRRPSCVWALFINEPHIPGEPVVGWAQGTSGTLEVAYPKDFCGVLQADVLVGPAPWIYLVGHRMAIQTAQTCVPTSTTPSTTEIPTVRDQSELPFTVAAAGTTPSNPSTTVAPSSALASLPFTGAIIKPLILLGAVLIAIGSYLLTPPERRRRSLRGARTVVRTSSTGESTSQASHWFLGE